MTHHWTHSASLFCSFTLLFAGNLLAADGAALSAVERNDQRVRHVHLERLTNTINNLLALEHIMAVHVAASRDSAMDEASHTDDDDDDDDDA